MLFSESSVGKLASLSASLAWVVVPTIEETEADEFPTDGEISALEEGHRKELEAQENNARKSSKT